MNKVILIRYGELFLKGRNRKYFERLLNANIINALKGVKCQFYTSRSRSFVGNFDEMITEDIIVRLSKVFGIHSMSIAVSINTDIELIKKTAVELAPKKGSFRITVNRADKRLPLTSLQYSADIGGFVLASNDNLSVDLHHPDNIINIDIRENGTTYIYYTNIKGAEGMPVGCAGKGLLLLSGGIDSPVAGYMMAKRGMTIHALHFHSYPFTSELAKQKVIDLGYKIMPYCGNFYLFFAKFTPIQEAIHEYCREDFMITVMRRIMMRVAEKVANKNHCAAIITGESLGQVASQTLESMTSTESVLTDIPLFRPLIAFDKSEIIEISRRIDTFETSILPYEDCCTVFLPKNPIIKPKMADAELEESKIPDLDILINECVENIEVIRITNKL